MTTFTRLTCKVLKKAYGKKKNENSSKDIYWKITLAKLQRYGWRMVTTSMFPVDT